MGSWDGTCMLTQVPIGSGPVRAMVLARRSQDNIVVLAPGTSDPDEFWQPVGLWLQGEYDGFGRIQGIDDTSPAAIVLKAFFADTALARHRADDLIVAIDERSRGERPLNTIDEDPDYAWALVPEPIFQAALTTEQDRANRILNAMQGRRLAPGFASQLLGNLAREDMLRQAHADDAAKNALVEYFLMAHAIQHGRKQWLPQAGQGSQNDTMIIHRALAHAILAYIPTEEPEDDAE